MSRLSWISVAIFLILDLALSTVADAQPSSTTPIQHVVVVFDEQISFDHYFGTYPTALNPPGQPRFNALPNTSTLNGFNPGLLTKNGNLNPANGAGAANPFRLNRSQALTADQNNNYALKQQSFDLSLMDLFPSKTGVAGGTPILYPPAVTTTGMVMGYYDGNTVTAMWNYAQHFALNDNSYTTQFGSSSPGAVNLISGQTNGIIQGTALNTSSNSEVADGQGGFTLIGDADPLGDVCADANNVQMNLSGTNAGNLLNTAGLSWGWFQGGFDLTITNSNGTTGCNRSTVSPITGLTEPDYVAHDEPFQFYASTQNPAHSRPTSAGTIGLAGDPANHQYDIHDFFDSLAVGHLAAVSFLKPASYQDAHPGNSNPLDEQSFVVNVINTLEQSPFWNTTAVIIAYDDSGGWYDHQMGPLVNASFSSQDFLTGSNACGTLDTTPQLPGPNSGTVGVNGRCGYGVRTPLLVISPWAKPNYVDHTVTDQTSVLRFIEDNWSLGRIGGGSFDALANPINSMFNFTQGSPQNTGLLILSTVTGQP
ncbi:MAG TPA: alkaline phosphatase family protein [Bryobacteraceae bacterium]